MKTKSPQIIHLLSAILAVGFCTGCASTGVKKPSGKAAHDVPVDQRGAVAGTGIESQDLVTVTDKMARKIVQVPQIANAQGTPRIVLQPVENATRFRIDTDLFLARIRGLLNEKATGKAIFLARDRMAALEHEREMKRTGQVTSSSDPNVVEFKGADFFLTGKLHGLSTKTAAGMSDYILYSFQLIDVRTSDIIWESQAEIKKEGLEDAVYR